MHDHEFKVIDSFLDFPKLQKVKNSNKKSALLTGKLTISSYILILTHQRKKFKENIVEKDEIAQIKTNCRQHFKMEMKCLTIG